MLGWLNMRMSYLQIWRADCPHQCALFPNLPTLNLLQSPLKITGIRIRPKMMTFVIDCPIFSGQTFGGAHNCIYYYVSVS